MASLEEISAAVIAGRQDKVRELTREAIEEGGIEPLSIINEGLIPGMNTVGRRFRNGEMFVPEVLIAARAMSAGVELVKPLLLGGNLPSRGTVVLGTVKGDLHDIGKNLVGMMLEGCGYKVIDLGIDLAPEKFVAAVIDNDAQAVGLSALLTTTMPGMQEVIERLKEAGLRDRVKVLVGGAPLTPEFAGRIGADGYAPDAASAAELLDSLMAGGEDVVNSR